MFSNMSHYIVKISFYIVSTTMYEVCPESIGHTVISPRHSVQATSAAHERQQ